MKLKGNSLRSWRDKIIATYCSLFCFEMLFYNHNIIWVKQVFEMLIVRALFSYMHLNENMVVNASYEFFLNVLILLIPDK